MKNNFNEIMLSTDLTKTFDDIKLIRVKDDIWNEVHIFIHGFTFLGETPDYQKLKRRIRALRLKGKVFILSWKSEWYFDFLKVPYVDEKTIILSVITSKPFLTSIINYIPDAIVTKYRKAEKKAENIGKYLKNYFSTINLKNGTPINLIGHSLGCRIIHFALMNNNWDDYNLQNIYLLAGATDASKDRWKNLDNKISGKIYNIYSTNDKILFIKELQKELFKDGGELENNIGQQEIEFKSEKIINIPCEYGHSEYIESGRNLKSIFKLISTKTKPIETEPFKINWTNIYKELEKIKKQ